jgi:hypothetical protein
MNKNLKKEFIKLIEDLGLYLNYSVKISNMIYNFYWDLNTVHLYEDGEKRDEQSYYVFVKNNLIIGILNNKTYVKNYVKNNIPKNWKNLSLNSDKIFVVKSSQKIQNRMQNKCRDYKYSNKLNRNDLDERLNKYKYDKRQNTSFDELRAIGKKLISLTITENYDGNIKKLTNEILNTWQTITLYKNQPESDMYMKNVLKLLELNKRYLK